MLEELNKLRESITVEQMDTLKGILGEDMSRLFYRALVSKDEDIAKKRIAKFSEALRGDPTKAFRLYRKMSKEQKAVIQEFMED